MTEYFTLAAPATTADQADVDSALRRAWNACAGTACPTCGVSAWQYCRNQVRGSWLVTRFHRPRQEAAGAVTILAEVGIHGLSWAKGTGSFAWDARRTPTV